MSDRIAEYMGLAYPIELVPDPDGGYVAQHPDLPGCVAQGETPDETVRALTTARRLWFESRVADGLTIPRPTNDAEYSGRFVLRLPRTVHAQLARLAVREGVSLNQYVLTTLSRHLGAAPFEVLVSHVQSRLTEAIDDLRVLAKQRAVIVSTDPGWPNVVPQYSGAFSGVVCDDEESWPTIRRGSDVSSFVETNIVRIAPSRGESR